MFSVNSGLKRAALISVVPFVLVSTVAMADNPDTTTLPNGAELSVEIFNPITDQEFQVPAALGPGGTIDVLTDGEASVGQGVPNIHMTFVIDVSGSTGVPNSCGGGLGDILDCEKLAVNNVIADPNFVSILDVGVSVFAGNGQFADMTPAPGDDPLTGVFADATTVVNSTFSVAGGNGGVAQFTPKGAGNVTNMTAGLVVANTSVGASGAGTKRVIFLSDGDANPAGSLAAFNAAALALGATIDSFAFGAGTSCGDPDAVSLQRMANLTGGICTHIPDPANLPGLLPNLIATSLDAVTASLGGNPVLTNTVPGVPAAGPISVLYDAIFTLGVGDYLADAEATGSDSVGSATVTAIEPFHLLQLTASPDTASNELSEDSAHTVFGQILGGTGPDRDIDFLVSGQNAGTAMAILATPGGPPVAFNYTVPVSCDSLGQDTITVSTTIAGESDSIEVTKYWVDTTLPVAECVETENPHGNNKPKAPGNGDQGQNQDGFYELLATDNLVDGCEPLDLYVTDDGTGHVFGPFPVGTTIKYTQDDDRPPEIAPMGGNNGNGNGQSNHVDWHIWGHGDAVLTAEDESGYESDPVSCLVPPPPQ